MIIKLKNKLHDIEFSKYKSEWSLKLNKSKVINHKGLIQILFDSLDSLDKLGWYHTSIKLSER